MTKNERQEATKARILAAAGYSSIAAQKLAALHRSASLRSQTELVAEIEGDANLRSVLVLLPNGCYVAA